MTDKPIRIQLSRAKGWRMPANTVKVDRTTKWGNPFKVGHNICMGTGLSFRQVKVDTSAASVVAFREMLAIEQRNYPANHVIRDELRGKNVGCWCGLDDPCHADVLLELANREELA